MLRQKPGVAGWFQFARCLDVVSADVAAARQEVDRQVQRDKLFHKLGVVDEVMQVQRRKTVRFADYDGGVIRLAAVCDPKGVHIFEVCEPIGSDDQALLSTEWEDIEFEVALDSGSQDHVCDEVDCPGYLTEVSPGSSRGQCFVVGNGEKLPNRGQRQLNMEPMDDAAVMMSKDDDAGG